MLLKLRHLADARAHAKADWGEERGKHHCPVMLCQDWGGMGPISAELGLRDARLGTGMERYWAGTCTGRGYARRGLGGRDARLGWDAVGLTPDRDQDRSGMVQCQAAEWDRMTVGWKRTECERGVGCCSPHPTAEGPQGARLPGQAGCCGGAPYPKDGPGVEILLVPVKEQKVVGEEEDVDAQPGCLQGKVTAS